MRLSDYLLQISEDFIDSISSEEFSRNEDATEAIENLKIFLCRHVDGWLVSREKILVHAVRMRIKEIWSLMSKEEKCENTLLESYYQEFIEHLSNLSNTQFQRHHRQTRLAS